ncbi:hypothetical protein LC574_22510, partial [Nostoc sp. CHAB 5715]|nr:hypothetical protein [Nostoc sp. CHAB 5715]
TNWTLFDKTLKYCTQHSPYPPLLFSLRSHGIIIRLFVTLTGLPESHPEHYRYNGTPILQIDGKNLGTFAPDSPKLPIGATFAATLQPDGSSIILKVNPESINLPEVPLPESEPKLDTAGQFRAIHREFWRKEMFDNLVEAIATTYEQRQANQSASNEIEQFKIGSHWTAYVQPSGDFIVRNEGKRTICREHLNYQIVTSKARK